MPARGREQLPRDLHLSNTDCLCCILKLCFFQRVQTAKFLPSGNMNQTPLYCSPALPVGVWSCVPRQLPHSGV